MTIPSGEAGIQSNVATAFPVTGTDGSIPGLADRTQSNVSDGLKTGMQTGGGWLNSSNAVCGLLANTPIVGSLVSMGSGSNNTAKTFSGIQILSDFLCGAATGNPNTTGTTAQTVKAGVQDFTNTADSQSFTSGIVAMGGSTGSKPKKALTGMQAFLGQLCGITTGSTNVSATTPATVVNTAQGYASTAHLLIGGRANPTATGADLFGVSASALGLNASRHVSPTALTPATAVSLKAQNLLISQDFTDPYTIVPDNNWSHDATVGDGKLGSAKVVCDGNQVPYLSNEIPVEFGGTVEVTGRVEWQDLVYTGDSPIILGVEKYRLMKDSEGYPLYVDVGWQEVDHIDTPGANGDWSDLAGVYEVEPRVDQVRFLMKPAKNATSGTIHWDNLSLLRLDLIDDLVVPGLGNNVDNIVTKLYGVDGEGFTRNDSAVALGNTAATITALASRVAALEAEGYTGTVAGDDFLWTGNILDNPNWGGGAALSNGYGYYAADNVDAAFHGSAGLPTNYRQEMWFDWQGTDAVSADDYQVVQVILDSASTTSAGYKSAIRVMGRVAADWSSYVVAEFVSNGTWSLRSYAAGAYTAIASGTCTNPGLGKSISLFCGDKVAGNLRHFKLLLGTITLFDGDEVGTASVVGASNRKYGWGAWSLGGLYFAIITFLPAQGIPAKIDQWLGLGQ